MSILKKGSQQSERSTRIIVDKERSRHVKNSNKLTVNRVNSKQSYQSKSRESDKSVSSGGLCQSLWEEDEESLFYKNDIRWIIKFKSTLWGKKLLAKKSSNFFKQKNFNLPQKSAFSRNRILSQCSQKIKFSLFSLSVKLRRKEIKRRNSIPKFSWLHDTPLISFASQWGKKNAKMKKEKEKEKGRKSEMGRKKRLKRLARRGMSTKKTEDRGR